MRAARPAQPIASILIAAGARRKSAGGRFGFPSRGRRGFTLVELLVALGILSVIAVLSWRGIDSMTRAQQLTQQHGDQVLALQAGLAQWRADLDALMSWPAAPAAPGQPPATTAASQRSLAWDGRTLRITRSDAGDATAGLRVVAWTRQPTSGQWLRWQSPPLTSQAAWAAAWDAAARWSQAGGDGAPAGGASVVVVARALDWQLHYFRNNAWTHPLSSGAESGSATQLLPDGVRLFLTLAPGQALAGPLVLDWVRPDFSGAQP